MCISVFALLRSKGKLLVGVTKGGGRWDSEWLPTVAKKNTGRDLGEERALWRLPSAYIYEGEHPVEALGRVLRGQLGVRQFANSSPRVFSYAEPSEWYPGNKHWDLAFAFEVTTKQKPRKDPHWTELLFLDAKELRKRNFGWNDDFVREVAEQAPPEPRLNHPRR